MKEIYRTKLPLLKEKCNKSDMLPLISKMLLSLEYKLSEKDVADLIDNFKRNKMSELQSDVAFEENEGFGYQIAMLNPSDDNNNYDNNDILFYFRTMFKEEDANVENSTIMNVLCEFVHFDLTHNALYSIVSATRNFKDNAMVEDVQSVNAKLKDLFAYSNVVEWFIRHHLCATNGGFAISKWPIRLRYEDGFNVKNIINGNVTLKLPVVISRVPQTLYDAGILHKADVGGEITVLTMDDPSMFEWLDENVNNIDALPLENQIAIFYPNVRTPQIFTMDKNNLKEIETEICEKLTAYYDSSAMIDLVYTTFDGAYAQYVGARYDDLLRANTDLREQLKQEKLKNKNISPSIPISVGNYKNLQPFEENNVINNCKSLTLRSKEKDFYPNELREIVMDSLAEYRSKYVPDNSRRATILDSVLQNTTYDKAVAERKQEIIDAFKGESGGGSPTLIRKLEKLGYTVKSTSNHLKITYHGDNRYQFIISKTPSDTNAMENVKAELCRRCF